MGKSSGLCKNQTPEFLHGLVERDPSLTGCCVYKNRVFWGHLAPGVLAHVPTWKYLCVSKCLLTTLYKILCSYLLECLFLQFNNVLGCARISARLLSREQFGGNLVFFFVGLVFVLPSLTLHYLDLRSSSPATGVIWAQRPKWPL